MSAHSNGKNGKVKINSEGEIYDDTRCKFTVAQVRKIRELIASGEVGTAAVAKYFNCTPLTIRNMVQRKTYSYIDPQ